MKIQPDSTNAKFSNIAEVSSQVQRSIQKLEKRMEDQKSRISPEEIARTKQVLKIQLSRNTDRVKVDNKRSVEVLSGGSKTEVAIESKKIADFAKKMAIELNLEGKGGIS